MAEIHLYVHGRGRGHASRALHIADELRARGHRVRAFAGPDAVAMLAPSIDTTAVPSLPPRLSLRGVWIWAHATWLALRRNRAHRPDVVVSDGDLPGLAAAHACRIPTVAVGHGLAFHVCTRPPALPRAPWRREALRAAVASFGARRKIAINFVPLTVRRGDAELAAPPVHARTRPSGAVVLAYFRDGLTSHRRAALAGCGPDLQVFAPHGSGSRAPDPEQFAAAFSSARAVIASAGSQLIAECIAHGVPILAVYDRRDDEQRLNATMLASSGLGHAVASDALDRAVVRAFLDTSSRPRPAAPTVGPSGALAVAAACEALLRGAP